MQVGRAPARDAGDRIGGRYEVVDLLGRGGMAMVYRVVDLSTTRELALKLIRYGSDSERERGKRRLRFRGEFHTNARLRHPRILEVYDYGVDAQRGPFYTMELLDGSDVKHAGMVAPVLACRILRDIASALAFLHAQRLVHRDVAPGNVWCKSDGSAKLIDLGVIGTIGLVGEIAGTPPCMAPEMVRGLPLDPRADLFGLGATAYQLLAGRPAFPVTEIHELEQAWRSVPAPPSTIQPDVPRELDDLVLSLLALDPLVRPNLVEVIDRLSAIGRLEPAAEPALAHGYLTSGTLVGRRREMAMMRGRIARASSGRGAAILLDAPTGTGKSRLLREIGLEAQLAGATLAAVGSEHAGQGPYGVIRDVSRALLAAAPKDTIDAAAQHVAIIGHVLPELHRALASPALVPALGAPNEDRLRLQSALSAWLLELVRRRPLVIVVDDGQRCDEASAAVLATLAHASRTNRLLLVVARRTDEPAQAAAALASIGAVGRKLQLRGLRPAELDELVRSVLGDVPNLGQLASWLHKIAGDSPLHCMELLAQLVDRGTIRYLDGTWLIPADVIRSAAPAKLADALDVRVARLPPQALTLAETLSVHGGELTLDLCRQLADTDEPALFVTLDQLTFDGILVGASGSYRFRHDGLREALLRRLDGARQRALHLSIARALEAVGELHADREAELGWHFLHGGEVARGAELLERAGRRHLEAQSFVDAIAPLEAALAVYEGNPAIAWTCVDIKRQLLLAGAAADRDLVKRHGRATLSAYVDQAGLDRAAQLRPFVGLHLGLVIGISSASARWLLTGRQRHAPNPIAAIRAVVPVMGCVGAVHLASRDVGALRELAAMAEPLEVFGDRLPAVCSLMLGTFLAFNHGHFAEVRRLAARALHIFEVDGDALSPAERRMGEGLVRVLDVFASLHLDTPTAEYEPEIRRIESLGQFLGALALLVRALHHHWRGEEEVAQELERRAEIAHLQLGAMWSLEAFAALCSWPYAMIGDVLGLKRTIERLERLTAAGCRHEGLLELARADYHRARGELEPSKAILRGVLARRHADDQLSLLWGLGSLAETQLAGGEYEAARESARGGLALCTEPTSGRVLPCEVQCLRVLALADAALGDPIAATRGLDRALARRPPLDQPLLRGILHEARALLAADQDDWPEFLLHREEVESCFRPTRNPVLLARIRRLDSRRDQARDAGSAERGDATAVSATPSSARDRERAALLGESRTPDERARRALELLIEASHGASGYLFYVRDDGALELVASSDGSLPSERAVAALRRGLDPDDTPTVADAAALDPGCARVVLHVCRGDRERAVGAALLSGAEPLRCVDRSLLDRIASEIYEIGDVSIVVSRTTAR
jgi:hypothetical protein